MNKNLSTFTTTIIFALSVAKQDKSSNECLIITFLRLILCHFGAQEFHLKTSERASQHTAATVSVYTTSCSNSNKVRY